MRADRADQTEFGDFQTPIELARDVCSLLKRDRFRPASVLEPTCGRGRFVRAALEMFPDLSRLLGYDINRAYVEEARAAATSSYTRAAVEIREGDFFHTNWTTIVAELPQPILVLGNPPWVTNAELGTLGSGNLPAKSNTDNLRGIDALTGSSNFDISEWMLRKNLEWLNQRSGMLAVLCKTSVARKVLLFAWKNSLSLDSAAIYRLDANRHFGASVEACLLVVRAEQRYTPPPIGTPCKQCTTTGGQGNMTCCSLVSCRVI